jgi:hypothetical protein
MLLTTDSHVCPLRLLLGVEPLRSPFRNMPTMMMQSGLTVSAWQWQQCAPKCSPVVRTCMPTATHPSALLGVHSAHICTYLYHTCSCRASNVLDCSTAPLFSREYVLACEVRLFKLGLALVESWPKAGIESRSPR